MTGDLEPRPHRVPAVRLDDPEQLRAELARVTAELAARDAAAPATRVNRLGPWQTTRSDAAQPLRTSAGEDQRRAAANIVVAFKAMGAAGLAVAGLVALVVVLTILYGLWRIALRFAAWASDGNALAGGLALVAGSVAIVGTGMWLFLRLTSGRAGR